MKVTLASVQYAIVLHNREWKISFNGRHYGPYATKAAAMAAAVAAARRATEHGYQPQVLVQGGDYRFRSAWPTDAGAATAPA
jgi:hypothetical protein